MFSYLQMPFLQALGYAIANSVWQTFLLWLIVLLINTFVKTSSHLRYTTALSAQVGGFVWFLTTLQFYYRHCEAASAQVEQLFQNNPAIYTQSLAANNDSLLSFVIKGEETLPYLSIAYLLLLSILVTKWVRNFLYTKQLSVTGLSGADHKWQVFINEMSDRLDIMQEVKVYLSSFAKSPLTIGYLKPVILLPVASINHLSAEQLEAVLLHELAHIKRADYIINLLISVVEIVLFFNPFTRLLSRTIQKERENCCDDWVLQYQYNPAMYAEALLRIACLQKQTGFQMNAASQQKGDLLQRVKRLLQPAEKRFNYKHQIVALLLITGLLFSIAWLQPNENNYRPAMVKNETESRKTVVITPLIAQVDNPFFNGASLFSSSLQEDVNKSIAEIDKKMTDSLTKGSMQQAKNALDKVTPRLLATVSSGNWQKMISQAGTDVDKSLQTIDWSDFQDDAKQWIDSSDVFASVDAALSKADKLNEAKQNLDVAKKNMKQLQQNNNESFNFVFNGDYLKQLSTGALASLQNLNLKTLQDSVLLSVNKVNTIIQQQNKEEKEWQIKRQQWIKDVQKSYQKAVKLIKQSPQLILPPPPPVFPEQNKDMDTDDESETSFTTNNPPPPAYSWSYSDPVYQASNVSAEKPVRTIRIISNGDSASINIFIQIRQ